MTAFEPLKRSARGVSSTALATTTPVLLEPSVSRCPVRGIDCPLKASTESIEKLSEPFAPSIPADDALVTFP